MTIDEGIIKGVVFIVALPLLMSAVAESFIYVLREDVGSDLREFINLASTRLGFSKKTH